MGEKFLSQQTKIIVENAFPPPPALTTHTSSHLPSPSHTHTHTHAHAAFALRLRAGTTMFINSWERGTLSGKKPVAYQSSFASTFMRPLHLHMSLLFMDLPWARVDEIFVAKGSEMAKIKYVVN